METHKVFVYGTLRRGGAELFKVPGQIYDLGWFPGIVLGDENSKSFVVCERLEVDDEKLAEFDRYEGFYEGEPESSLYLRVPYEGGWIYVYNHSVEGYTLVEGGDWLEYTAAKKEKKELECT